MASLRPIDFSTRILHDLARATSRSHTAHTTTSHYLSIRCPLPNCVMGFLPIALGRFMHGNDKRHVRSIPRHAAGYIGTRCRTDLPLHRYRMQCALVGARPPTSVERSPTNVSRPVR